MVDAPDRLRQRLVKIKMLAMDVDGVLTDAGMYYSEQGDELKKFNTRDGKGIALLRDAGIRTALITGEDTRLVSRRAAKLKVDELRQGVADKLSAVREIMSKYDLRLDEIAYVGDDINDLQVLESVGLAVTVADGTPENQRVVHYVTQAKGGEGAIREIGMLILEAQGDA